MRIGDMIQVPTGYGREKCIGILIGIRYNPADVKYGFSESGTAREIVDVLVDGEMRTAWKHHVKVINANR